MRIFRLILISVLALSFQNSFAQSPENNEKKLKVTQSVSKSGDGWFGEDKFAHFFVSGFLTAYGYTALRQPLESRENTAIYISGLGVTGLGITKEIYDLKSKKGHPSFKDILANLLGVGTALFLVKVL